MLPLGECGRLSGASAPASHPHDRNKEAECAWVVSPKQWAWRQQLSSPSAPARAAAAGQPRRVPRQARQADRQRSRRSNAFSTFNPNTAAGNVDVNSKVSYATHSGFFYIDNKLNIVRNDKFGKMEKTSDNPLTVSTRSMRASNGPTAHP